MTGSVIIAGRRHRMRELRMKDFIELNLAIQDLVEAGQDPEVRLAVYTTMASALAGLLDPKPDLDELPLPELEDLYLIACRFSLGPPPAPARERAPGEGTPKFSREELLLPLYQVAFFEHVSIEDLLALTVRDFNARHRIVEALWARLRLDLLDALDHPHLTSDGRSKVRRSLLDQVRGLAPSDASPWSEHFERAERLL